MITKGILAGVAATAVLSALMLMKSAMGVMPGFNAIKDWTTILAGFGLPASPVIGWLLHLGLGSVVWGILFAILEAKIPGSYPGKGIAFGLAAWLAMMVIFMPMAGHGLFALGIGPMATMATLVLHVIYGVVLGFSYGRLATTRDEASA